MDYMTLKEASEKWGVSARQINYYCSANRIEGAIKVATIWLIPKSANMSVFQKKVAALLARIRKQSGGECYNDGNLYVNFSEMAATLNGETISFTPLEYRLLKVLTKNPQIVLTRQVLLEKLWDIDGNFVDEHALTSAISRIRGKIERTDKSYIKTVYGMGYMWIGGGGK